MTVLLLLRLLLLVEPARASTSAQGCGDGDYSTVVVANGKDGPVLALAR